jgi:uncharacterized protein
VDEPRANGCIVQFAKAPRPGLAKTRLCGRLSEQQAAAVARTLVRTVSAALDRAPQGWSVRLCADDPEDPFLRELAAGSGRVLDAQGEGDLGARMARAAQAALRASRAVIVVGSDCLGYDADYLHMAAAALEAGQDAVLGPAADGGYVLVGLSRYVAGVFDSIGWGAANVAQAQRRRFRELGLGWRELPLRADIDRPEDLWMLCPAAARAPAAQALVIGRLSP